MKINEVDPRNYDSDIDYYDAVNRAGRKAYRDPDSYEKPDPYDAEDAIAQQRQAAAAKFRQKRETQWDTKQEGTAPNGQKYNSRYIINAVDKFTADMEEHSFTDYHWGAKKLVDKEYGKDGDRVVLTLYMVDNHKYGMWKPWADQPAQESAEQGVSEGGFKNKTAVFSGYSNYMNSRAPNVFKHYGIKVLNKEYFEDEDIVEFTVISDGDSLDKARAHLERSNQFGGMIRKQGVAEGKDIENYHHTGPGADKKAQAHAKKLGNEWGAYRHPSADKWDNLHIVVKKHEAPSDLKGVAEGSKEKTPGIALSKAYKKDFDDKKPGQDRAETALTGAYSKTGKPGGELKKKDVAEAFIAPALSASNANAEFERTKTFVPRGYKGRVDTEVSGQEEYRSVIAALKKLAQAEDQHVESGLSGTKMSVFSKTMDSEALSDFLDMALQEFDQGVAEGFKNTYSVGDRVDSPLGTGVIVAVSPHISVDGRVKVKLDDPSRAGEDGKYKDTFVLDTTQLKHIADEKANPYAIGMAQAMKSTGDKPPLKKSTINKAHEIARAIKKGE